MDVDYRCQPAFPAKLANQPHDLAAGFGVQRCGRFVDQKKFGVLDQRAGDADPLALTARKFVRTFVGHVQQAHAIQQAEGLIYIGLRKFPQEAPPEAHIAQPPGQHVFHHSQALDQRVFLKDHSHRAARLAKRTRTQTGQFHIIEPDLAAGRFHQPVDASDHRRLARARGAD